MQLVLNEVDAENVRTDEFRGREYLVAPTVPIKAMGLDGGYVPEEQVAKSAPAWNGTPVTLNHPRDENGNLASANSPDVAEKTWLGYLFNAEAVDGGESMTAEIWIDVENAKSIGGEAEQVLDTLTNGEPLSVSTSYWGDKLPAGNYDGEHRDEVVGNLRPDHLAVLPNKEGRCSVEDGCVAGPQAAANAVDDGPQLRVAAAADDPGSAGEEAAAADDDGTQTIEVPEIEAETMDDLSDDERESFMNAWLTALREFWPGDSQTANESAESDTPPASTSMSDRDDMISTLVEDHGFTEESLTGMGDSCLEQTYNSFTSDETDDDPNEQPPEQSNASGSAGANEAEDEPSANDDVLEAIAELESKMVTEDDVEQIIAENQEQSERESLVDTILQNSDEWSEDELSAINSTSALEKIRDDVTTDDGFANFEGQRGATASANSDDTDMPPLSVSAHLEQEDAE